MNEHRGGNGISVYPSCIILLFLIMALTPSAAAADAMFRANPEHTGEYDSGGIEPTNTELWRFTTGGGVSTTPAIANGIVYFGSDDDNLYAIDAVTGKEKWRFDTGGAIYQQGGIQYSSSPAVVNGVVYVASLDRNLYAIDAITGKEKWRSGIGYKVLESSPVVANGIVYVGSDSTNLHAIDAITGKEKWRFRTLTIVESSPAVSNGVVYVGSNDFNLYAVDVATGTEKWRFDTGGSVFSSSPAVSNGVVYVASFYGNLYAIDAVTGKEKWRFATEYGMRGSPAVSNGVVYVASENLYAIDAATGKERWRSPINGQVFSSPAVSNGVVYFGNYEHDAVASGGSAYGPSIGYLYAIDAVTGTKKWQFATGSGIRSSPAVSNGVVYVGSDDGNLYAIGQKPTTLKTTPTATPTPVPTPSNNGDFNLSLPIITVLALLFLASSGYGIYRMKRKPSGDQIPVIAVKEPNREQPLPTAPISGVGDSISNEDLLNRIASIEQKVSALSQFKNPALALIAKTRDQYQSGVYNAVQSTLKSAENAITSLAQCETQLAQWKKEGYDTTSLESLNTDNVNTITAAFRDFEKDLATLRQLEHRVEELKRSCSTENVDPAISQRIVNIESQLHDPRNIPGIKQEIKVIEQEIRDQQEKSRQQKETGQLLAHLQIKAEKLTRYASLTDSSFTEVQEQIATGKYDDARKTLRRTEDPVDKLLECETSLAAWTAQGYTTTTLEGLHPWNADEVIAEFQQYRQNINRLETIAQELESKKSAYPALSGQPETADSILSIEQNLKNPGEIKTVESAYRQVNDAISELEARQRTIEQNLRDQAEKVQREAGSPAIKREIDPIIKSIRQHDIPRAQERLQELARQQLSQVNAALSKLRTDGAVVSLSSDPIWEQIAAQHYGDVIINSEKVIAELTRVQETYAKASVLRSTVTEPEILALFENGKYEEFICASEEQQKLTKKITELKEKGRKLLVEAEKFGKVPERMRLKLDAQDIPTIESTITELETFSITAKPELTLTLDHTQLIADDWDRMTIQIVNHGNAHAKDVRLTFSDEFDTKWIKPATINAGATTSLDIGIRPKVKGKIPLEVTATYRDGTDKEYHETHEFWIDVVEKSTTVTSVPPVSPVGPFTPRPLTPKQLPPDLADRYTESAFIGKGGFARVFKAKRKDGKLVAVKIPISMDAMTGKSFIAEMQNWTKLSHPNIVRLYDFNIMPMPFFEEELCDNALADQAKPIESEEAAWILFNICEGLKFAHAQKIIHRDLKPQNILLKNGVPKISDWGLSRIISETTTTTAMSFTPYYAAPEQINNRVKDERTDIWQLGVILYELVTGALPFKGDSMVEIGMNIATKDPKRPVEIKPEALVIDAVVMKCLEKDPKNRYQSVLELQKDLALYLRKNYADLLKTSVSVKDYNRSAFYCGDLVMINLLTGDIPTAYKYLLDLIHYSKGDMKEEARELSEQIKMRMDMGLTEIPDELILTAEMIVHQVSVGFRKTG